MLWLNDVDVDCLIDGLADVVSDTLCVTLGRGLEGDAEKEGALLSDITETVAVDDWLRDEDKVKDGRDCPV